ncbi:carbonic anhydrase [Neurospora crassa]|nr:carbonic anhydrase [Neurospora crassa]
MARLFRSLMLAAAASVTPVWSLCSHNTFLHPREEGKTVEVKKFGYIGVTGPLFWSSLAPENTACSTGRRQSPIDMTGTSFNMVPSSEIQIDIPDFTEGTEFENLGTTIEVIAKGGSMTFGEKQYTLQQFHFHLPSEHLDNGTSRAMEMHMVWQTENQELAVIGTYIDVATEAGSGRAIPPFAAPAPPAHPVPSGVPVHPHINKTAPDAPPARFRIRGSRSHREQEVIMPHPTNENETVPVRPVGPDAPVSGAPTVLLETIFSTVDAIRTPGTVTQTPPLILSEVVNIWKSGHFQGYMGSLTTPPCSEGVMWLVSTQTLRVAPLTFENVRSVIGFNSRLTQNAPGEDNILAKAGCAAAGTK